MTRTQAATALRQRMLDDMRLRNMADGTRRSYVRSVADFSAFRCAAEPSSMVVRAHMVQKPIRYCWRIRRSKIKRGKIYSRSRCQTGQR